MLAPEEARRLGHNLLAPSTIPAGLIGEALVWPPRFWKSMGVNLKDAPGLKSKKSSAGAFRLCGRRNPLRRGQASPGTLARKKHVSLGQHIGP